jgi:hypothetical protein
MSLFSRACRGGLGYTEIGQADHHGALPRVVAECLDVLPQGKQVGDRVDARQLGRGQRMHEHVGDDAIDYGDIKGGVVGQSGWDQFALVVAVALDRTGERVVYLRSCHHQFGS